MTLLGPAPADELTRLRAENAALRAQMQHRDDELEVATRMLEARARTMTSVIDAVTEQSIIGTDVAGVVRVWNPGAERMLGLPRAAVVRRAAGGGPIGAVRAVADGRHEGYPARIAILLEPSAHAAPAARAASRNPWVKASAIAAGGPNT